MSTDGVDAEVMTTKAEVMEDGQVDAESKPENGALPKEEPPPTVEPPKEEPPPIPKEEPAPPKDKQGDTTSSRTGDVGVVKEVGVAKDQVTSEEGETTEGTTDPTTESGGGKQDGGKGWSPHT